MEGQETKAGSVSGEGEADLRPILTLTMREMFEMANSMGIRLSTII